MAYHNRVYRVALTAGLALVAALFVCAGAGAKPTVAGSYGVTAGLTPKNVAIAETVAPMAVYVTNTASTSVTIFVSGVASYLQLNGGVSSPWGVAVYDNGASSRVYVTNKNHDTVSVIDASTNLEITGPGYPIPVSGSPMGIGVNSVTNKIYVANNFVNTVSVINGATATTTKTLGGFGAPYGVAVNSVTNKIYVTNNSANTVRVIDGSNDSLGTSISVAADLRGIAVDENTNRIYVVAGSPKVVYVIDGSTDTVIGSSLVGGSGAPEGIAVSPESGLLYVTKPTAGTVRVLKTQSPYSEVASSPVTVNAGAFGVAAVQSFSGEPWTVIVGSGSSDNVDFLQETDTYAPVFGGLKSATDGGTSMLSGGPTVLLNWDAATDATLPITYNVYKAVSAGGEVYSSAPFYSTTSYGTVTITAGGLAYGTMSYFVVRATDGSAYKATDTNSTEKSAWLTDGAAPAGGGFLTGATNLGTGGAVKLDWAAATDDSPPVKYNVYMGYTATGTSLYYSTSTATGVTLTGLQNNTFHYFIARAKDAAGLESTNAITFSTTPTDIVAPTFGGLSAASNAATGGTVSLSWTAGTDSSVPITYAMYVNAGATVSYSTPAYTTTLTNYAITGLVNGTQYAFAVRARDAYSNYDSNVVVMTVTPTDMIAPTFTGANSCQDLATSGSVKVSWSAGSDNTTPIYYNIYRATSSGGQAYASWDYQTSATTSYTVTGLSNGTRYYFVVRAKDSSPAGNEEANTVEVNCKPTDGAAPVFAGITSATPTGNTGEIMVSWATVTDVSPPVQYNIYRGTATGAENFSSWTYQASGTSSYTATGLADGSRYFFVVRAQDAGGLESTNTTELSATPNDGTAPVFAGITGLVDTKYSGTLTASWSAAADPSVPVTYEVYVSTASGGQSFASSPTKTTSATSVTLSGLANNIPYYVVVRARDSGGITDYNTTQLYATPTDQATPTFAGITLASNTTYGGDVTLSWSAATDPSGPVTYYIYQKTSTTSYDFSTPSTTTTYSPYTLAGLTNGVTYSYRVGALDNASPTKNLATNTVELSVTPSDLLAPTFTGVASVVDAKTSGAAYVYWNPATDRSGIAYYNIYVATNTTNFWSTAAAVASGTATSATISGLTNATYYYVGVRAVDNAAAANKDANTVWKNVTPSDTTAPTFGGITGATDTTLGSQVTLSWSAATDPSSPITYAIYYAVGATPSFTAAATTTQASTGVTITGLLNDKQYYFAVRARDGSPAANETSNTQMLSATPTDVFQPTFAGIATATNTGKGGEVKLGWATATDNSLPITYNIYQASSAGGENYSTPTYTSTQTTYTATGLTDGAAYYFVVRARDASTAGNEEGNVVELSATPSDTSPPVFAGISAASNLPSGKAISISWATATDNSPPVVYNVYLANFPGTENYSSPSYSTQATSMQITGLNNMTWYYVVVRASDSAAVANIDTNTVEKQVMPMDSLGPMSPTSITASPGDVTSTAGDEFATITWVVPTKNMDGSALTDLGGFNVYRSASPGMYSSTPQNKVDGIDNNGNGLIDGADSTGDLIPATATSYVDNTSVVSGTLYYYVVTAADTASPKNQSPFSDEVFAKPTNADEKIPSAPDSLAATPADGKVTLTWSAPIMNTDNTPLTDLQGYKLYRSLSNGNYSVISTSTITARTYTDNAVVNGTKYYYVVTAIVTASVPNESSYSDYAAATPNTPANVAPGAPTNFAVSSTDGGANLSWSAPVVNADGTPSSDIAGYNVYRSLAAGSGFAKINAATVTQMVYSDTGLTNGTNYYYYATCLDTYGNEGASSSIGIALYGNTGVQGTISVRDSSGPVVPQTGYPVTGAPQGMTVKLLAPTTYALLASGVTDGTGAYKIVYASGTTGVKYVLRLMINATSGFLIEADTVSGGTGYSQISKNVTFTSGSFTTVPAFVLGYGPAGGDGNCDGTVDMRDYVVFKKAYDKIYGTTGYNKNADFDGNGEVDMRDYTIFKKNYEKTGTAPAASLCAP